MKRCRMRIKGRWIIRSSRLNKGFRVGIIKKYQFIKVYALILLRL